MEETQTDCWVDWNSSSLRGQSGQATKPGGVGTLCGRAGERISMRTFAWWSVSRNCWKYDSRCCLICRISGFVKKVVCPFRVIFPRVQHLCGWWGRVKTTWDDIYPHKSKYLRVSQNVYFWRVFFNQWDDVETWLVILSESFIGDNLLSKIQKSKNSQLSS